MSTYNNSNTRASFFTDTEGNNDKEHNQKLEDWLKFERFSELPDKEPDVVIHGLLRVTEKLGITAGTKRFKTWFLLYLAYCVSNGLPFLDFQTTQSNVVFFDMELSRHGLKKRLKIIQAAIGKGDFENLTICSLKGKSAMFCRNFYQVAEFIKTKGFKVVIIDPVYKFLIGGDESNNSGVAKVLEMFTQFCMDAEVALGYVHHHSKGNQAGKESMDRGSGAGAWSRDPDAVMDLTEQGESLKEARKFSVEITVREFPPIENFVLCWEYPLLKRDTTGLDPDDLKQPKKSGTAASHKTADFDKALKQVPIIDAEQKDAVIYKIKKACDVGYHLARTTLEQLIIAEKVLDVTIPNPSGARGFKGVKQSCANNL